MSIDAFIDKFAFAIEAESSELSPHTDYKSLDVWDSLNTLAVIAMADADYNVALSGDDVDKSTTIADLWSVVENRIS